MYKSLRDYVRAHRVDVFDSIARCDVCGGYLMLLGVLGNTLHTRCRNCGMTFSENAAKAGVDVDEEPADWTNERD